MSALDKMLGFSSKTIDQDPKPIQPKMSMQEQAMMKMLGGLGLDASMLGRMQNDVMSYVLYTKERLDKAEEAHKQILENQAVIMKALGALTQHATLSLDDSK